MKVLLPTVRSCSKIVQNLNKKYFKNNFYFSKIDVSVISGISLYWINIFWVFFSWQAGYPFKRNLSNFYYEICCSGKGKRGVSESLPHRILCSIIAKFAPKPWFYYNTLADGFRDRKYENENITKIVMSNNTVEV